MTTPTSWRSTCDRTNDVTFQKTLSVNDWYLDGGDGYPLGSMQLIGKVQGVMMKSWATKWPQVVPRPGGSSERGVAADGGGPAIAG